ncbi:MAG: ParA family protein [Planctomycetota bacterium]
MSRPARIVAMLNQKGGVGKTTTTVNLGAAIAHAGRRVCLLDLDPQAHVALHLGIEVDEAPRTLYDVLVDPACDATDAIMTARERLDVIVAEVDLAGAETELARQADRQRLLRRKFEPVMDAYDVVLIDCPPSLGLLSVNALTLAREVFVPMQAHFLALQGVGKLLETVGLVCQSVNPDLRVTGIILCMHEHQTTLAREIVADLDAFFAQASEHDVPWRDCRLLHPPIRRNIKVAEAPSFGNTIFDYAPWCAGALDYRRLAAGLLEAWDTEDGRADDGPDARLAPEPDAALDPALAERLDERIVVRIDDPDLADTDETPNGVASTPTPSVDLVAIIRSPATLALADTEETPAADPAGPAPAEPAASAVGHGVAR